MRRQARQGLCPSEQLDSERVEEAPGLEKEGSRQVRSRRQENRESVTLPFIQLKAEIWALRKAIGQLHGARLTTFQESRR